MSKIFVFCTLACLVQVYYVCDYLLISVSNNKKLVFIFYQGDIQVF